MGKKAKKAAKKPTRAQRSAANKLAHARAQATREKNRVAKKAAEAAEAPDVTPYPKAGRKVVEFEEALDASMAGGTAAPVRPDRQPAEPPDLDLKVIAEVCQIPFDLWSASQAVDGLKLSHGEARMMAKPAKQLLDHYVPQIPVIAWAWISLAVVSYSAMKSRLMLIQIVKKAKLVAQAQAGTAEARGMPTQEHGGSPPSRPAGNEQFPTMVAIKAAAAQ